jgi:hypothetical protein
MHGWWRTRYRLSDGDGVVMSYSSGEKGREGRYKVEGPGEVAEQDGDLPATHYYSFLLWLAASRFVWILELPQTGRCRSRATALRGSSIIIGSCLKVISCVVPLDRFI